MFGIDVLGPFVFFLGLVLANTVASSVWFLTSRSLITNSCFVLKYNLVWLRFVVQIHITFVGVAHLLSASDSLCLFI